MIHDVKNFLIARKYGCHILVVLVLLLVVLARRGKNRSKGDPWQSEDLRRALLPLSFLIV